MIDKRNFYINGKWVSPSKPNNFEVIDPSTEEPFAIISLGSIEDADKAISAAKNAFETWRETSKEKRLSLLEKFRNSRLWWKRSLVRRATNVAPRSNASAFNSFRT